MERREVKRLELEFPVEFIVLGQEGSARREGLIRSVSEDGLSITSDTVLETGSFLRIEIEEATFFGEVRYCNPCKGGSVAGLYVEQVLMGQSELSRLMALAKEHAPPEPAAIAHP